MNVDLSEYLGMKNKKYTQKKLNLSALKAEQPEIYDLIKNSVSARMNRYNLFIDILSKIDVDLFYRTYLELKFQISEYVYFIKNDTTGLIKIGMTNDPHDRLLAIRTTLKNATGIEHKLRYVGIIYMTSSSMRDYEKCLHDKFSNLRKYGEWFALDENDIIKNHFSNSYVENGTPFVIENDSRKITNENNDKITEDIWTVYAIHKMMDKSNKKHLELNVNNVYFNMLTYYDNYNLTDLLTANLESQYMTAILNKAKKCI